MNALKNLSPEEWETIESKEHDLEYLTSRPFSSKNYRIDVQQVIAWQDYCYKKGIKRVRGHRTKRFFEIIKLDDLSGKSILDVGCGNGQYAVFFALLGAEVAGVDITPVGIEVAKKIAEANDVSGRCHFSVQNAAEMDFDDDAFDIVVMHEVLHHAIKYPGVKEETFRVLKDGGAFICTESLDGNPLFRLGRMFSMRGKEAKGDIVLTISDLEKFAKGFSKHEIELMSLFFMAKRFLKGYLDFPAVRSLLYLLKKTDDVLLTLFPFLKKYCGEAILTARK